MQVYNSISLLGKKELLFRKRINDLLYEASSHAMVTIVAGPGFGKTEAVATFMRELKEEANTHVIAVTFRNEDNDPYQLNINLSISLHTGYPDLVIVPSGGGLRDPIADMRNTATFLNKKIFPKGKLYFVIDNFERLDNPKILELFRDFISIFQINAVHWIFISRTKSGLESTGLSLKGGLFQITQGDLAFTREETEAFFQKTGLVLEPEQIDKIMEDTEGWPLAVYVVNKMMKARELYTIDNTYEHIGSLLENEFFRNYTKPLQWLLLQLSWLNVFSARVIGRLAQAQNVLLTEVETLLRTHPFVHYNSSTKTYRLHKAYQNFLLYKRELIPAQRREQLYDAVGEAFFSEGRMIEALSCYEKNKNYPAMLHVLDHIILYQQDVEAIHSIQNTIESFPAAFQQENPLSALLGAYISLYLLDMERAHSTLTALQERLAGLQDAQSRAMLGEVYLLLATWNIFEGRDTFVECYRRAAEAFPAGARMRGDIDYLLITSFKFFLPGNHKGELERLLRLTEACIPYIEHFKPGAGEAFHRHFAMEAAYFQHDLALAKKLAQQQVYAAIDHRLCFNTLYGRWSLLQLAYLSGDLQEALKQRQQILDYADRSLDYVCIFVRDQIEVCFDIMSGNLNKIPKWFVVNKSFAKNRLPIFLETEGAMYGYYLLRSGDYISLISYVDWFEQNYANTGTWQHILRASILRALAYLKLNDKKSALDALWHAYQMSYENNIITPYINFGKDMRTLMSLAQRSSAYSFDQQWINSILQKSSTFAKKASTMERQYLSSGGKNARRDALSKREEEVLRALAQGLTREEIANLSNISQGTVKTIIKQIYTKLDAVNNAAAVRIAYETGIFQPNDPLFFLGDQGELY